MFNKSCPMSQILKYIHIINSFFFEQLTSHRKLSKILISLTSTSLQSLMAHRHQKKLISLFSLYNQVFHFFKCFHSLCLRNLLRLIFSTHSIKLITIFDLKDMVKRQHNYFAQPFQF